MILNCFKFSFRSYFQVTWATPGDELCPVVQHEALGRIAMIIADEAHTLVLRWVLIQKKKQLELI